MKLNLSFPWKKSKSSVVGHKLPSGQESQTVFVKNIFTSDSDQSARVKTKVKSNAPFPFVKKDFFKDFLKIMHGSRNRKKSNVFIPEANDGIQMVYGSSEGLTERQSKEIIYHKSVDEIGKDYYYSYCYSPADKKLRFISVKSEKHISKMMPLFAYALAKPGNYFFRARFGGCFFLINTNEGVSIKTKHYKDEYEQESFDLDEFRANADLQWSNLPKSVHLHWSLEKQSFNINIISLLMVLLTVGLTYLSFYIRAESKKDSNIEIFKTDEIRSENKRLPNLFSSLKEAEEALQENGLWRKMTVHDNTINIEIEFADSAKAQVFQNKMQGKMGVKIEGNKVILTTLAK